MKFARISKYKMKNRISHFKHDAIKLEEEFQEFYRKAFQAAMGWFSLSVHIPCCILCKNYQRGLFLSVRVQL